MLTWFVHASIDGIVEAMVVGSALAALAGRSGRGIEG
jgi:hypothetical protein